MGSGSSKDKNSKTVPSKADNVSKSSKALTIESKEPFKIKKDFNNTQNNTETHNSNNKTNNHIQNGSHENYNSNKKVSETNNRSPAKTVETNTNLGRFDSDSESEGEDIAEVLAATRRAQSNRVQEQNFNNNNSQN